VRRIVQHTRTDLTTETTVAMRYNISLALILAALWLAVSGVYKPPLLVLGAGSVALVVWLSCRMHVVGVEHNPVLFSWRLPVYWAWLVWQIALANLHVARRVLSPGGVRPELVSVPVSLRTAVGRVTYGNSVTLTPGTVTLDLGRDRLTAHALDGHSAAGLRDGAMARRLAWLEGPERGNGET
jgi:multicomponent Na+:H+ antiporter subunit E